jgi:hypothetical protein
VQAGFDKIDELVEIIMKTVEPKAWEQSGNALKVLSEKKLEITGTKLLHEQIADLLEALRRQYDLIVNVHGELIEVERALFEKEIQPKLAKQPEGKRDWLVVHENDDTAAEIRKKALTTKTNDTRIADGKNDLFLSQRTAFTYQTAAKKKGIGYHGVTLGTGIRVTADRRFLRLALTQTVTELVEINSIQLPTKPGEEPPTVETPNLHETKTTVTVEVDDGLCVVLPVAYTRPGNTEKKTVLLTLVQPKIIIGDEEREKLRQKMMENK